MKSKAGAEYLKKKAEFEADLKEFENNHGFPATHVVENYIEYHDDAQDIDSVVGAVSKWGGSVDWHACVVHALEAGIIKSGSIRRAVIV